MNPFQKPNSAFLFSDLTQLKLCSAFKVEKAFLPQPNKRPSTVIAYRVMGIQNHQRIELAQFAVEQDAQMVCGLFETVAHCKRAESLFPAALVG